MMIAAKTAPMPTNAWVAKQVPTQLPSVLVQLLTLVVLVTPSSRSCGVGAGDSCGVGAGDGACVALASHGHRVPGGPPIVFGKLHALIWAVLTAALAFDFSAIAVVCIVVMLVDVVKSAALIDPEARAWTF